MAVEKNNAYSQEDLNNLNITNLDYYLTNYDVICPKPLPEEEYRTITVNKTTLEDCNIELYKDFEKSFSISLFFPQEIGEITCLRANILKFVFKVDRLGTYYSLKGIKIYSLIVSFTTIIVIWIIVTNITRKRIFRKND